MLGLRAPVNFGTQMRVNRDASEQEDRFCSPSCPERHFCSRFRRLTLSHISFTLRGHSRRMASSGFCLLFWLIGRTSRGEMARRRVF